MGFISRIIRARKRRKAAYKRKYDPYGFGLTKKDHSNYHKSRKYDPYGFGLTKKDHEKYGRRR